MFDTVQMVDTSELEHKVLVVLKNGNVESSVPFPELPPWFKDGLPNVLQKISN